MIKQFFVATISKAGRKRLINVPAKNDAFKHGDKVVVFKEKVVVVK